MILKIKIIRIYCRKYKIIWTLEDKFQAIITTDVFCPACWRYFFKDARIHYILFSPSIGHLYKVNVPVMVAQTSGRPSVLQHPVQVFPQLGQPSVIQGSVPLLSPWCLPATPEKAPRMEAVFQQPTVLHSVPVDRKHLDSATSGVFVPPGREHGSLPEALLSQHGNSPCVQGPGVGFHSRGSPVDSHVEPVLSVPARVTPHLRGGPVSACPQGTLLHPVTDAQPHLPRHCRYGGDSANRPGEAAEPSSLPVSKEVRFCVGLLGLRE